MTSILESEYVEPNRPYSQNELGFNRSRLFRNFRLGKHRANHKRCNHFYLVRSNGRKEREMIETKNDDVGNCSVCWKLSKTPSYLREKAQGLIQQYTDRFEREPRFLTYERNDLENVFYQWLYEDQQDRGYEHRRRSLPSLSKYSPDDEKRDEKRDERVYESRFKL